jgi:hypothetical protein
MAKNLAAWYLHPMTLLIDNLRMIDYFISQRRFQDSEAFRNHFPLVVSFTVTVGIKKEKRFGKVLAWQWSGG